MKPFFEISKTWKTAYPNAHAGVLVMTGVLNPAHHAELVKRKIDLEAELRTRFSGQDRIAMLQNPILQAYDRYYRGFKKTYHVQLQLESILFKGKSIPSVAALPEAMFMAEMNHYLLTAGHDLDALHIPIKLDVAQGKESYTTLRGDVQTLKPGDMLIADTEGIISNIIYGPDRRTQITPQTRNVVFTVYAPGGIDESIINKHLQELRENVLVISPEARVELQSIYGAG